jgi:hypothetical protein
MMAPLVITNEVALSEWLRRKPRRHLLLNLDGLTSQESHYWEKRINKLNADCGCSFGAAGLLIMLVMYPSVLILGGYHQPFRFGREILVGIVFVFAFAGLCKSIGLLRSRWLLKSSLLTLSDLARGRQRLT